MNESINQSINQQSINPINQRINKSSINHSRQSIQQSIQSTSLDTKYPRCAYNSTILISIYAIPTQPQPQQIKSSDEAG